MIAPRSRDTTRLAFSPSGEWLASVDGEGFVSGWVGPDGDTILLFLNADEPGESTRSIVIGTRLDCQSDADEDEDDDSDEGDDGE